MKHYTLEQWTRYARQEPPMTEEERTDYETHLTMCDACLELYMQGLELAAGAYPELTQTDKQSMYDSVMLSLFTEEREPDPQVEAALSSRLARQVKPPARSAAWLRHPIFHYAVAASITAILMSSGAFQTIVDRLGQEDKPPQSAIQLPQEQEETRMSVSRKIMDKTIVMLDSIQPTKHERGGTR